MLLGGVPYVGAPTTFRIELSKNTKMLKFIKNFEKLAGDTQIAAYNIIRKETEYRDHS